MIQKLIFQLALALFKAYLLPALKSKSHKLLNTMSDNVMGSEYNPIDKDTVGDIRKHADKAIDELLDEKKLDTLFDEFD